MNNPIRKAHAQHPLSVIRSNYSQINPSTRKLSSGMWSMMLNNVQSFGRLHRMRIAIKNVFKKYGSSKKAYKVVNQLDQLEYRVNDISIDAQMNTLRVRHPAMFMRGDPKLSPGHQIETALTTYKAYLSAEVKTIKEDIESWTKKKHLLSKEQNRRFRKNIRDRRRHIKALTKAIEKTSDKIDMISEYFPDEEAANQIAILLQLLINKANAKLKNPADLGKANASFFGISLENSMAARSMLTTNLSMLPPQSSDPAVEDCSNAIQNITEAIETLEQETKDPTERAVHPAANNADDLAKWRDAMFITLHTQNVTELVRSNVENIGKQLQRDMLTQGRPSDAVINQLIDLLDCVESARRDIAEARSLPYTPPPGYIPGGEYDVNDPSFFDDAVDDLEQLEQSTADYEDDVRSEDSISQVGVPVSHTPDHQTRAPNIRAHAQSPHSFVSTTDSQATSSSGNSEYYDDDDTSYVSGSSAYSYGTGYTDASGTTQGSSSIVSNTRRAPHQAHGTGRAPLPPSPTNNQPPLPDKQKR